MENSNPCSSSDTRDHRRESRPADNTSIEGQCSDFQSDASHPDDRTRCIPSRSRRWEMLLLAGMAWWSRHNMVAVALLRKCSLCASFPRQIVRRSRGHHRHIGNDSRSTAPSRFSKRHPTSRHRSPNMERVSWWSMWWSQHSRFAVAHQLLPAQASDLVSAAGRNSSGRSDRRVLDSRRVPEPSESLRDQRHRMSLRTNNGRSMGCRWSSSWSAARVGDSGE